MVTLLRLRSPPIIAFLAAGAATADRTLPRGNAEPWGLTKGRAISGCSTNTDNQPTLE